MLIGLVGVLFAGTSMLITNGVQAVQLRIDKAKAYYLAQAGVKMAVHNWLASSVVESGRRWAPVNPGVLAGTNMLYKAGLNSGGTYLHSNYAYLILEPKIEFVKYVTSRATYGAGGTTVVGTLGAGVTVAKNDFLVVYVAMDANAGAVTCADTGLNTYTARSDVSFATHVRTVILTAPVTTALAAGNTITVTIPATTARAMSVAEFSGVNTVSATSNVAGTGTSTTPVSTNITPTQTDELLIGSIGVEGVIADTFTAGAGYSTNPPTRVATANATILNNVIIDPEYKIMSPWKTGISYVIGNAVSQGGSYYTCAIAHTSGVFATDLAAGRWVNTINAGGTITSRSWAAAIATFYEPSANWFTSGVNRQLRQWRLKNIHNASSIILNKIIVTWTPVGAELLNGVSLNGVTVSPAGTFASGATIDLTASAAASRTLAFGDSWGGTTTYLQWNASPADPVKVTCQFIFSGDSTTTDDRTGNMVMCNGLQAGGGLPLQRSFTVTSTGQVVHTVGEAGIKVMDTVKATVSSTGANAEITDWDEESMNIP